MVIIDIIKILLILTLCGITSYTDCSIGKISNRITFPAAAVAIVLDVVSYCIIDNNLLPCFLVNSFSVICISVSLYVLKIWAGGDTKLLCIIALLTPVSAYWDDSITAPFLAFIVGIAFSTSFFYLIGDSIAHIRIQQLPSFSSMGKSFLRSAIRYFQNVLILSGVSVLYNLMVTPYIQILEMVYTILCVCLVSMIQNIDFFYSRIASLLLILLNVVVFLVTKKSTLFSNIYVNIIVLVIMLVRIFIDQFNYQEIDTIHIKAGMVLSRASSTLFRNSRVKGLPDISDETLSSRLSPEEVSSIIRWKDSKYGTPTLVIVRKIPFAIFISLGTIFYFILRVVVFC